MLRFCIKYFRRKKLAKNWRSFTQNTAMLGKTVCYNIGFQVKRQLLAENLRKIDEHNDHIIDFWEWPPA
jgi:hypothetical protein